MKLKPSRVVFHTKEPNRIGLGDAVEKVARPIASTIDALLGTKLLDCDKCKKRKEMLNEAMPDIANHFSK